MLNFKSYYLYVIRASILRDQVAWEAIVKADEILQPNRPSDSLFKNTIDSISNSDRAQFLRDKENQLTLPFEKNLHYFEALEDSSIIDIVLPNYDMKYRRWDYYKEVDILKKIGEKTEIYYSYPHESFDMDIIDFKGENLT